MTGVRLRNEVMLSEAGLVAGDQTGGVEASLSSLLSNLRLLPARYRDSSTASALLGRKADFAQNDKEVELAERMPCSRPSRSRFDAARLSAIVIFSAAELNSRFTSEEES